MINPSYKFRIRVGQIIGSSLLNEGGNPVGNSSTTPGPQASRDNFKRLSHRVREAPQQQEVQSRRSSQRCSTNATHKDTPEPAVHGTSKPQAVRPVRPGHVGAPSVLQSPDSGEQSCATGSRAAIHSQTPSARASRGETRAGKRAGQMNQEETARTTFRIPQSHLTLSQAINSVETHRRHKALLAVNEDTNYCHT